MSNPKTKFTFSVPDQFEIEPVESYFKSYTDRIFLPIEDGETVVSSLARKRRTIKFHSVRNEFFDFSNLPVGYQTKLRNLAPLFGNGFLLQRFMAKDIYYNVGDIQVSISINSLDANIIESASIVPKENITSPSQNLISKFFCTEEQFADTCLPRPADIVQLNGGKFTEGYAEYYHPGSFLMPPDAEGNFETTQFGVRRNPKKFKLVLGSSDSSTFVTNSQDSSVVSDNIWYASFPFENKYKNLQKLIKPSFDKKYEVSLTQSLISNANFSGGLDLVTRPQTNSYEAYDYSIQWCFSTIGQHRETTNNLSPWHNKRRYITLLDVPVVVSSTNIASTITKVIIKPTGNLLYPEANEVYKGFYGVYHKNNDISPYYNAIESQSGSWESSGGGWRFGNKTGQIYNPFAPFFSDQGIASSVESAIERNKLKGWRSHEGFVHSTSVDPNPVDNRLNNIGKFPSHYSMAGYSTYGSIQQRQIGNLALVDTNYNYFPVEDFNIHYLRLTGWKYGVYHALPCYSNCYFRRGRYGMFRDMLEQRVNTKFIKISKNDSRQNNSRIENLGASVSISFLSSSTSFVTSSNPTLNTRDSGIYDVEARSGQPFNDR